MKSVFERAYEQDRKVIHIYGDEPRRVVKREGHLYLDDSLLGLWSVEELDENLWKIVK